MHKFHHFRGHGKDRCCFDKFSPRFAQIVRIVSSLLQRVCSFIQITGETLMVEHRSVCFAN